MRNTVRLAIVLALVLSTGAITLAAPPAPEAPILGLDQGNVIPGQYIVVFKDMSTPEAKLAAVTTAVQALESLGGSKFHEYSTTLNGFAARLPDRALKALRRKVMEGLC